MIEDNVVKTRLEDKYLEMHRPTLEGKGLAEDTVKPRWEGFRLLGISAGAVVARQGIHLGRRKAARGPAVIGKNCQQHSTL